MRKIREMLRLHHEFGFGCKRIASSCQVSKNTVLRCLERARQAGLEWPLPEGLDDQALEAQLYGRARQGQRRPVPDWSAVERELGTKGVTRRQLWLEYRACHPEGYDYSWFCARLREHLSRGEPTMRQHHAPGEVLFVDYAGLTVMLTDPTSGEQHPAQLFVAILGASQLIYAELTATQQKADWLGAHVRALNYYGGVPAVVTPDNLKAGVNKAHRYDPQLNIAYTELAEHCGFAVVPARVRKPRDKGLVENAVQIVERELVAPLRHHTFFSLGEANAALRSRLEALNHRPFTRQPGTRQQRFETLEREALRALPAQSFEPAEWRRAKLAPDYHVTHAGHAYSVPHRLIGQTVEMRISAHAVEILHAGQRVASHSRCDGPGQSTVREHMPPAHQAYAGQDAEGILRWASTCGPATEGLIRRSFEQAPLRKTRRLAEGLQRLARLYGKGRLEAACERARALGLGSYTSLESMLRQGLEQAALAPSGLDPAAPIEHDNVRGPAYYH